MRSTTGLTNDELTEIANAITEASAEEKMLQFFGFMHLPPHLIAVSCAFGCLALDIVAALPRNTERTVALRKLLEAKDAAVRSVIYKA